jgi:hypothetical protein
MILAITRRSLVVLLFAMAASTAPGVGCGDAARPTSETGGRLPTSNSCTFRDDLVTISVGSADVYECEPGSEPSQSDPGEAYEFGCNEVDTSALYGGLLDPNLTYWVCL